MNYRRRRLCKGCLATFPGEDTEEVRAYAMQVTVERWMA